MSLHDPKLPKTGDVVRATVNRIAVFGLFFDFGEYDILVTIPEVSWIPSFASCEQVAIVGDEHEIKILHIDKNSRQVAGSIRAVYPENDPWKGQWKLLVGDECEAIVVRWVKKADRCGDLGGYLLALRPAALVMLCGHEAGALATGEKVVVRVISIDNLQGRVVVALKQ